VKDKDKIDLIKSKSGGWYLIESEIYLDVLIQHYQSKGLAYTRYQTYYSFEPGWFQVIIDGNLFHLKSFYAMNYELFDLYNYLSDNKA
jgi:hypothetical protein